VHFSLAESKKRPERSSIASGEEPQRQRQPQWRRHAAESGWSQPLGDCAGAAVLVVWRGVWVARAWARTERPEPVRSLPLLNSISAQAALSTNAAEPRSPGDGWCCCAILITLWGLSSCQPDASMFFPSVARTTGGCADHSRCSRRRKWESRITADRIGVQWSAGVKTVRSVFARSDLNGAVVFVRTPIVTGSSIGGERLGQISSVLPARNYRQAAGNLSVLSPSRHDPAVRPSRVSEDGSPRRWSSSPGSRTFSQQILSIPGWPRSRF